MKLTAFSIYLKSNMDRFIAYRVYADGKWYNDLKSNMDRFIVTARTSPGLAVCYLKSNMDRFIVRKEYQTNI